MSIILFVHGAFSRAAHCEALAAYFAEAGFDCRVPSLPGHGADHSMLGDRGHWLLARTGLETVGKTILEWLKRKGLRSA